MTTTSTNTSKTEQIKDIDSYAICLLKEMHEYLSHTTGGNMYTNTPDSSKIRKTKVNIKKNKNIEPKFIEFSWCKSIEDFLNQQPVLENEQMFKLLSSAKDILSNENSEWGKDQKQIFKLLEDIVQVAFQRGMFQDFFEKYSSAISATSSLNFDYKLPLFGKEDGLDLDQNNLLNYFATSLNMINEELKVNAIAKQHVQSLIRFFGKSQVIFITNMHDQIEFSSDCANLFYELDSSIIGQSMTDYFVNIESIKEQVLLGKNIELIPVKFIIPNGSNKGQKVDALLKIEISRGIEGEPIGMIYQLNATPIIN